MLRLIVFRWEVELQAELRELELQGLELGLEGEGDAGEEEEAWEAELQQMLDMHSEQKQD